VVEVKSVTEALVTVLAILSMALAAGACVLDDDSSDEQAMITANEVATMLKQELGIELRRETFDVRPAAQTHFESLSPARSDEDSVGAFQIDVFEDLELATRELLLPPRGEPDERGIHWGFHPVDELRTVPHWSATKMYDNLRVTWRLPTRSVDERWHRLDRLLSSL
jgi:hypothetical protein